MPCSYTFPQDHPAVDEADAWSCPHPVHEDEDHCIFHLPLERREQLGIDPEQVVDAFRERISERGERSKQFIGALFRGLDLSHTMVESPDNHPVNLSHARIRGDLTLTHAHLMQPLVLDSARIWGRLSADTARMEGYVDMQGTRFDGYVEFDDAVFMGRTSFREARFDGAGTSERFPAFVASFSSARFEETAVFYGARFEGRLDVRNAQIADAIFHAATIDAMFFGGAEIEKAAFTALRARDDEGYISFLNAELGRGILNQAYSVEDGEIVYPDESIFYNLEKATVGSVRLKPDRDGELFRYIRILETEWDGFDFANYEQFLEPGWDLHSYAGPVLKEGNITTRLSRSYEDDPVALEMTYRKAKKGAELAGDEQAGSEFFVNQMRYRRQRYRQDFADARGMEKVSAGATYLGSRLMGMVSGHGERPWRVIGTSLAVILACAVLYPLFGLAGNGGVIGYGAGGLLGVLGRALYFSTTTFATLGLGDLYPASLGGQLLAGIESLVGAMLMALLVFVLGKRA